MVMNHPPTGVSKICSLTIAGPLKKLRYVNEYQNMPPVETRRPRRQETGRVNDGTEFYGTTEFTREYRPQTVSAPYKVRQISQILSTKDLHMFQMDPNWMLLPFKWLRLGLWKRKCQPVISTLNSCQILALLTT